MEVPGVFDRFDISSSYNTTTHSTHLINVEQITIIEML